MLSHESCSTAARRAAGDAGSAVGERCGDGGGELPGIGDRGDQRVVALELREVDAHDRQPEREVLLELDRVARSIHSLWSHGMIATSKPAP